MYVCICKSNKDHKVIQIGKTASKYSLLELSIPNRRMCIDAHMSHFMSTSVFVVLRPIKI